MMDRKPSFMQSSEIYGDEGPIAISRAPATTQPEQRRADVNVMAESIADDSCLLGGFGNVGSRFVEMVLAQGDFTGVGARTR